MGWARVLIFRCAQWPISSLVPKNSQKKEFLKAYITCLYVLLIRFYMRCICTRRVLGFPSVWMGGRTRLFVLQHLTFTDSRSSKEESSTGLFNCRSMCLFDVNRRHGSHPNGYFPSNESLGGLREIRADHGAR